MNFQQNPGRHQLREKTHSLHESLHEMPVFQRLLDGSLNIPDYISLMHRFLIFYQKIDCQMLRACKKYKDQIAGYHYVPRAPMLERDVIALNGSDKSSLVQSSDSFSVPEVKDPGRLAGVAYVVDGSVLGGIMMSNSVSNLLKSDAIGGQQYWQWCKSEGNDQWKSALALIEANWQTAQYRPIIVNSALQTFSSLKDILGTCEDVGAVGEK